MKLITEVYSVFMDNYIKKMKQAQDVVHKLDAISVLSSNVFKDVELDRQLMRVFKMAQRRGDDPTIIKAYVHVRSQFLRIAQKNVKPEEFEIIVQNMR